MLNKIRWFLVKKLIGNDFCMVNATIKDCKYLYLKGKDGLLESANIDNANIYFDHIEQVNAVINKYPNTNRIR